MVVTFFMLSFAELGKAVFDDYWMYYLNTKDTRELVENKRSMVEALIYNFQLVERNSDERQERRELTLF